MTYFLYAAGWRVVFGRISELAQQFLGPIVGDELALTLVWISSLGSRVGGGDGSQPAESLGLRLTIQPSSALADTMRVVLEGEK